MAEHVDQPITSTNLIGPVGDVFDAMLGEEPHCVLGKAVMQSWQLPRHSIIDTQFLHVRANLGLLRGIGGQPHKGVDHLRHNRPWGNRGSAA